jgi:AcrR family transcriptional regulator
MPKIIDVHETKRRIIKATWRVIASEGIQAASFRRVAREAGCTTGLITHYFSDKNELVTYAYRMVMEKMLLDASAALERGGTVLERLIAAIEAIEPIRSGERDFTVVLMNYWAAAAFNEVFAEHCRGDYKRWRELIGKTISEGVSQGELRPDADVKQIADMLTLIADGLSVGITLTPSIYPKRYRGSLIAQVIAPFLSTRAGARVSAASRKGKRRQGAVP